MKKIGICFICKQELNSSNIAKYDKGDINPGKIRKDAFGNIWCQECTDQHDAVDWDEVSQRKLKQ